MVAMMASPAERDKIAWPVGAALASRDDMMHLQILARYVARTRGCDVDKPRNLAKSVTVE